jgi:hypothetical protein
MLCALLSADSAVADPILSEDGTAFQLGFPQVIVDKLNKFVDSIQKSSEPIINTKDCEPFIDTSCNSLSCEKIQKKFWMIIGAMAPYIDIEPGRRESLLSSKNLIRVAQTLLILNEKKISIPALLVVRIQIALDCLLSDYPINTDRISFYKSYPRRRQRPNPNQQAIEEYKNSLEEVVATVLNKTNTRS